MQSVEDRILARLYRKGRGFCFSGVDFADLGSSASVDKALSSLAKQEKIRRLRRGLYDYPHFNEELGGILAPDLHQAAMAIARKNGVKAQPSGALAANLLGLSTQVPAKMIYLTKASSANNLNICVIASIFFHGGNHGDSSEETVPIAQSCFG